MKTSTIFSRKELMPFQPKNAHIKILHALYRHQVLTTDLVIGAVGSMKSASTVKPNIQELERRNYLSRFKLATPVGNSPFVCVLAENGMKFLRDDYGYDMRSYKPPSEWSSYSTEFLMHPLELNKFILAASKINDYDPRVKFLSWERDYELQRDPLTTKEKSGFVHQVVPDAELQFSVAFPSGTKRRVILVELERNTHKRKAFEDKIRGIIFIAAHGIFEDRFNHPIPRVALVSTIDEKHVQWMKETTEAVLRDVYPIIKEDRNEIKPDSIFNRMFHLRIIPSLQGGDINIPSTFLEHSWLHPLADTKKQLYSLLDI